MQAQSPIASDAIEARWASLYRWHEAGEHIYRIREAKSDLSPELDLVRAPVHYEACGYELPGRKAWIVVARHQPSQTIVLRAPEAVFAYPEPMLSCCTNLPNAALASGVINLVESPRYGDLYLPAGKSGERWLHQDEIVEEEQRLHMALPYFFARPERTDL